MFSAYHIYLPGHTPHGYDHARIQMATEFRRFYREQLAAAEALIERIGQLARKHPNSVFIIAGDHGPWLTRGKPRENRRFTILDRHGIALGLVNFSNLCPRSQAWVRQQKYLTPSRMLAATLACEGDSRKLLNRFSDKEEFVQFGRYVADG